MKSVELKGIRRQRRKKGLRKVIRGTAQKPRLTVFRSSKHIYAQLIDDDRGITLCEASSASKDLKSEMKYGGNIAAAKVVGLLLAERAKAKQITTVCFDRNGFRFHGRLKGLAESVRENGLKF